MSQIRTPGEGNGGGAPPPPPGDQAPHGYLDPELPPSDMDRGHLEAMVHGQALTIETQRTEIATAEHERDQALRERDQAIQERDQAQQERDEYKQRLEANETVPTASEMRALEFAFTDPDTGLWIKEAYEADIRLKVAEAQKSGAVVYAILADVDGLRFANGAYGTEGADEFIKAAAVVLKERFGEGYRLTRGDELAAFVVVPASLADQAEAIVGRAVKKFENDAETSINEVQSKVPRFDSPEKQEEVPDVFVGMSAVWGPIEPGDELKDIKARLEPPLSDKKDKKAERQKGYNRLK